MKCQLCKHFVKINELGLHIFNFHKIKPFDYAVKYLGHSSSPPFCLCGCRERVIKWSGIEHGWARYLKGHNPFDISKRDRVKHSKAVSKGLKKLYASGYIAPRKGKTKENDLAMKRLSEMFKGRKCPEKIKQQISKTLKEKYKSGEIINPFKGKTKETYPPLAKISKTLTGRACPDKTRNKISKTVKSLHEKGISYGSAFKEKQRHKAIKQGEAGKLWAQSQQGRKALSKSCTNKNLQGKMQITNSKLPTRPERMIIDWFSDLSYVGNGQRWITFKGKHHNPDFISNQCQNKIVEVFGNYWHKKEEEKIFIDGYASVGFKCLVVWESEILNDPDKVKFKITRFLRKER